MKTKNIRFIAAFAFVAWLTCPTARAQDSTNTPPPRTRAPMIPGAPSMLNFDFIATQLALTDAQKTNARPIIEQMAQKLDDLRKESAMQAAERRAKTQQIHDAASAKLKAILAPAQYEKWTKMPGNRPLPSGPTVPPHGGAIGVPANSAKPPQ